MISLSTHTVAVGTVKLEDRGWKEGKHGFLFHTIE